MKKIILITSIATVLLSACNTAVYHCISINIERPDTLDIKANNKRIVRYSEPTKQGDTIQIWYTDTTASNYIVKSIK